MRRFIVVAVVLAILAALLSGCTYTTESTSTSYEKLTSVSSPVNVVMFYINQRPAVSEVNVFSGKIWLRSRKDGGLFSSRKGIGLKLVRGEKVIHAGVRYGNFGNPSHEFTPWDLKGVVPLSKKVITDSGKWRRAALTEVRVELHSPHYPHSFVFKSADG